MLVMCMLRNHKGGGEKFKLLGSAAYAGNTPVQGRQPWRGYQPNPAGQDVGGGAQA